MNTLVSLPILTAMPTTAPAMPPTAGDPDPIFAAIDAHRQADAACIAVPRGVDIPDELGDRRSGAYHTVMRTRPTTPAGLAALTGWAREEARHLRKDGSMLYANDLCALTATIDDAARGMSGLDPWSPPPTTDVVLSADPIFEIIEKHQTAAAAFKEAVGIEYGFEEDTVCVRDMDPATLKQYYALAVVTSDAGDLMRDAGTDLVNTPPTTLAGIVALCEYIGPQFDDEEHDLPDEIDWEDDTQSTPAGAFANAIRSAVTAMMKVAA